MQNADGAAMHCCSLAQRCFGFMLSFQCAIGVAADGCWGTGCRMQHAGCRRHCNALLLSLSAAFGSCCPFNVPQEALLADTGTLDAARLQEADGSTKLRCWNQYHTLEFRRWLQDSLLADPRALDANRLQEADGAAMQALIRRKEPLPLQEERARLLREVRSSTTKLTRNSAAGKSHDATATESSV